MVLKPPSAMISVKKVRWFREENGRNEEEMKRNEEEMKRINSEEIGSVMRNNGGDGVLGWW